VDGGTDDAGGIWESPGPGGAETDEWEDHGIMCSEWNISGSSFYVMV